MGLSGNTKSNSPRQKEKDAPSELELDQDELTNIENLFNTGQYKELEIRIKQHLQQTPSAFFLYNILGLSQAGLEQFDKALISYQKVLDFQPDHAGVHCNIGMAFLNLGHFEGAIASYKKAKELDPRINGVDKNIGVSLNNLQRYEEAISYYNNALELAPTDHELHRNIGIACDNLGRHEEAIHHYLGALRNEPGDISTYNRLGSTLLLMDRSEDAVKTLEQAIKITAENFDLNVSLGIAYNKLDQFDNAITCLTRAIELEPQNPKAYVKLGSVMQNQERYDEALYYFDHALELNSTDPEIYCLKGTGYLKSGLTQAAIECFQLALNYEPDHVDALFLLGICLNEEGLYEEATAHFDRASSLSPNDASLYCHLGNSHLGLGRIETAVLNFEKTLSLHPSMPEALMGLGDCFRSTGNIHAAIEKYQEVLKLQPTAIRALIKFSRTVHLLNNVRITPALRNNIKACFDNPYIPGKNIVKIANYIIDNDLHTLSDIQHSGLNLLENLDSATSGILTSYLKNSCIENLRTELLLTEARARLLHLLSAPDDIRQSTKKIDSLLEALAIQSFLNGYIWNRTEQEEDLIPQLLQHIIARIQKGEMPQETKLFLLASYEPLTDISIIKEWALEAYENCSSTLKPLLKLHIIEPEREAVMAQSIVQLNGSLETELPRITTSASPYWDGIPTCNPVKYTQHIREGIFPSTPDLTPPAEYPQILVTECSTGKSAISAAQVYKNSNIFACGDNLKNLAYGKRKAYEAGINNIQFILAHNDELQDLGQKFEVIECYGSEKLDIQLTTSKSLLTSGGFIKLCIPSKLAEKVIQDFKSISGEIPSSMSLEELRSLRNKFIESENPVHEKITHLEEFYNSTSFLKLISVKGPVEYTIPEIINKLQKHSLDFLGFEMDTPQIKLSYQQMFPDDPYCINLANWHEFETLNPSTFIEHYIFWCRFSA